MASLDVGTRMIILEKYNRRCAYCGCKLNENKFEVDHITPKRRDLNKNVYNKNIDNIKNYNPTCYSCNRSKHTYTIEEWRSNISDLYKSLYDNSNAFRRLGILGRIGFSRPLLDSIVFKLYGNFLWDHAPDNYGEYGRDYVIQY